MQRTVWQLAKTNPRELVRSTLNTSEIQHRALTHLPDELLRHVPESKASYSLFQGFQASIPEDDGEKKKKKHGRHNSKGQKLLDSSQDQSAPNTPTHQGLESLKKNKRRMDHRLEMMSVRKNMCVSEIREIDSKIANLNTMRKIVLDRLGGLESEEADLEHDILDVENKLEDLQEELDDAAAMASRSPTFGATASRPSTAGEAAEEADAPGFMSESIYEKLPAQQASPAGTPNSIKKRKSRPNRRISMPVLHEHLEKGSRIRQFQAHTDMITALDFDQPFGTLITSAMDDTVRVWDLNAGRCIGMLEGHLSSVRCLQVSNNMVATGSMDASIKLWDLSQAEYAPAPPSASLTKSFSQSEDMDEDEEANLLFSDPSEGPHSNPPASSNLSDCEVFTLSAHVAEVTALHMHNNTLVSGSADKTLRQWDLVKGRCVQTLDVLWAAAQAAQTSSLATPPAQSDGIGGWFQPVSSGAGRIIDHEADFVGAVQVFDAALACGTADGMVRLWDLRSGSVSRSLVGHTGPVTALQFDDVHLITASADRSIRVSGEPNFPSPFVQPLLTFLSTDMGSSHRKSVRRIRLRFAHSLHAIRPPPYCLRHWRSRCQSLRQDRRQALGLRCRCQGRSCRPERGRSAATQRWTRRRCRQRRCCRDRAICC